MKDKLNAQYWNVRYETRNTPWDIGYISPPLQHYFDQLTNKNLEILIPGAGFAHEAVYLHQKGFKNVWVCDWAPKPLEQIKQNSPDFPDSHLLCINFFSLSQTFDLLIEQTFFCALPLEKREDYVKQVRKLLRPRGKLVGLLFDTDFPVDGPPFGGNQAEYQQLFGHDFTIVRMETCRQSISPRSNRELFCEMIMK